MSMHVFFILDYKGQKKFKKYVIIVLIKVSIPWQITMSKMVQLLMLPICM
jgi:hypothetical protein